MTFRPYVSSPGEGHSQPRSTGSTWGSWGSGWEGAGGRPESGDILDISHGKKANPTSQNYTRFIFLSF